MTERAYHNKNFVVITNERSAHYAEVGVVEIRDGWDTDLVWLNGSAVAIKPSDMRRLRPGDRIANP